MTTLSKQDVLKLARLARLRLSDEEVKRFQKEFTAILDYVEQLKDVDTEGLTPTYQVNGLESVVRTDTPIDYGVDRDSLLRNVPHVDENQIKVKRMIG